MDNGTAVEVFKSLNYCQLAKTSLVSKRFRDLIQTNRHRLALLYVSCISMDISRGSLLISKLFNKTFTPEEYNEWITRNQYSKQIPLENQMNAMLSTQHERKIYELLAFADPDFVMVYFVRAELNNENWPLFQHFIRLLTDPFIYLHDVYIDWTAQKNVFNLLTAVINPDQNRLQCHAMKLCSGREQDTVLDFSDLITWVKCHLLCDQLEIHVYRGSGYIAALFDFIMTGGHCTSAISITNYGLARILRDLAKKFMDLKKGDECQVVRSIKGDVEWDAETLKHHFGKFILEEEKEDSDSKELVFEFVNKDIDQICRFTATYF